MAVSNIERFDDIASRIFAELYQSFPVPQHLKTEDYVDSAVEWDEAYEMHLPTDSGEFFRSTVDWLIKAGYLRADIIDHTWVKDAVLTAKGLEVLRSTPDSLDAGPSIGDRLAGAANGGGKEVMRGLLSQALALGARLVSPFVGLTS